LPREYAFKVKHIMVDGKHFADHYRIDSFIRSYFDSHYGKMWLYGSYFISFCLRFDRRTISYASECKERFAQRFCLPYYSHSYLSPSGEPLFCYFMENKRFCTVKNSQYEINFDELHQMVNALVQYGQENCRTCWAKRLCSLCWVNFLDDNGSPCFDRMQRFCEEQRKKVLAYLQVYIHLKQIDPHIFENIRTKLPVKNEIT
jgi:hypothetical protein